jgi:hypothetical protein
MDAIFLHKAGGDFRQKLVAEKGEQVNRIRIAKPI